MNLLADEGVDRIIVERLRGDGYNVLYVGELSPGSPDDEVLNRANERRAVLVTADKDFGELVYRHGRAHAGVVLLRLAGLPQAAKATMAAQAFLDYGAQLPGAFTVISPSLVRIRRGS